MAEIKTIFGLSVRAVLIGIDDNSSGVAMTIDSSKNIGIGTIPERIFHVAADDYSLFERTTNITDTARVPAVFRHKTTEIMEDGFASAIFFQGKDVQDINRNFASIQGIRDGADTEGAISITAGTLGVEEFMKITSAGKFGFSETNPAAKFTIKQFDEMLGGGIRLIDSTSSDYWELHSSGEDIIFNSNGTDRMLLSKDGRLKTTGAIRSSNETPSLELYDIGAATNAKHFKIHSNGNNIYFQAFNDAGVGGGDAITLTRNGNLIETINFGISNDLFINTSTGNVGIGTNDPLGRLHIVGLGAGTQPVALADTTEAIIATYSSGASTQGYLGALWFGSSEGLGVDAHNRAAGVIGYSPSDYSSTSGEGELHFYTTPSGSLTSSNRMTIDGDGYVGIGTAIPYTKFEVKGGALDGSTYINVNNSSTDQFIKIGINSNDAQIGYDNYDTFTIGEFTTVSGTVITPRFTIDSDGLVGIGTNSPNAQLEVQLPTEATRTINSLQVARFSRPTQAGTKYGHSFDIFLGSYSAGALSTSTSRVDFKLNQSGTITPDVTVMTMNANGNVGIGIAIPDAPLHVQEDTANSVRLADNGANGSNYFYRNKAAADTVAPVVYINQEHGGDDQPALKIKQDGTGDSLQINTSDFVVDNEGNVGIGTTTPKGKLHSYSGASGQAAANTSADDLVLENTADVGLTFLCPSGNSAYIMFGDESNNGAGQIYYTHNTNTMTFKCNNIIALTIDSTSIVASGNVTVLGNVIPSTDNTYDVGSATKRWDDIWATNNVIQTSDERMKDNVQTIDSTSLLILEGMRPVSFKWKDYDTTAVTTIQRVQKTQIVQKEQSREEISLVDGVYVQEIITEMVDVEEDMFDEFPLYDSTGVPIMEIVDEGNDAVYEDQQYMVDPGSPPVYDSTGVIIVEAVPPTYDTTSVLITEAVEPTYQPKMHKVPIMEDKEIEQQPAQSKEFHRTHYGLIAQEFEQLITDLGLTTNDIAAFVYDSDTDRYAIRYVELVPLLIKGWQDNRIKLDDLEMRLSALE